MNDRRFVLLITCEHGGNNVPRKYRHLFSGSASFPLSPRERVGVRAFSPATLRELLDSHRGWDPGALPLAKSLARAFRAPLIFSETTRLLVDLNRSADNPRVFSRFTRALPIAEREKVLREFHQPHWSSVRRTIRRMLRSKEVPNVLHIGVHTFTPLLKRERTAEIGILYDPHREAERSFSRVWREAILVLRPDVRAKLNYPYRGWTDGLITAMRCECPERRYLGIELEVNQGLIPRGKHRFPTEIEKVICAGLREAIGRF